MKVFLSLLLEVVVSKLVHVIRNVLNKHHTSLSESAINSLQLLATEMYAANLITNAFRHSCSFDIIIAEFTVVLSSMSSISKTEQHCAMFLSILTKIGGSCAVASQTLQQDLIKDSKAECGVELQLGM